MVTTHLGATLEKIIGGADVKNMGELYKSGMDNRPTRLMSGGGESQVANENSNQLIKL